MAINDKLNKFKDITPDVKEALSEGGKVVAKGSKLIAKEGGKALKGGAKVTKDKLSQGKAFLERQKEMSYTSLDSLKPIVNVVNEAAAALEDKKRTIKKSSIPSVLTGALGAGVGSAVSFAALYGMGTVGLSAAGITSGLAAAGGTMVGGIFVLAAPIAIGAGVGVSVAYAKRQKQLKQEKERLYKEAVLKHEAIIRALEEEVDADKERIDYLTSLNILLQQAVKDLKKDMDIANGEI